VSDSASQRAQDQEVRFQQDIEISGEVTRGLTSVERDLANRQAIAFVFHPTPLQAAMSQRLHQDQAKASTLNADAPVKEMARTSLLETSLNYSVHPQPNIKACEDND
jgi:hypothetical protein